LRFWALLGKDLPLVTTATATPRVIEALRLIE
jgi:hypothetical protein